MNVRCVWSFGGFRVQLMALVAGAVICYLRGSAVQAGSMDFIANVSARYAPDLVTQLPLEFDPITHHVIGGPGVYQVDLFFTAEIESGDKGWANTAFSAIPSRLGLSLVRGSWSPNTATLDSNGVLPGGVVPIFSMNGDVGRSSNDLQSILASISSPRLPPEDDRYKLGTPAAPVAAGFPGSGTGYPTYLGSLLVQWDGAPGSTDLSIRSNNFAGPQYSFTSTNNRFEPAKTAEIVRVGFGSGPARTSLLPPVVEYLSLGSKIQGSLITATLPVSNPNGDPLTWTLESFSGSGASVDSSTGKFTWDSTGNDFGLYQAVIRATDTSSLTSTGTLSFDLFPTIPLPSGGKNGTMKLILKPVARYDDENLAQTLPFSLEGNRVVSGPGIYQVDVLFTANKDVNEVGWSSTIFDANVVGSGLFLDSEKGWTPHVPTFDSNGAESGGVVAVYEDNRDLSGDDFRQILIDVRAILPASDGRNKLGTAEAPAEVGYPSLLGSLFVHWDGQCRSELRLDHHRYGFSTPDYLSGGKSGDGAYLQFGTPNPEPTSIVLASCAVVAMLGFRCRSRR